MNAELKKQNEDYVEELERLKKVMYNADIGQNASEQKSLHVQRIQVLQDQLKDVRKHTAYL